MPILRRISRRRRDEWGPGHLSQLRHGHDFFRDAWGSLADLPMDRRDEWPDAETLADMRACWEQHRDDVVSAEPAGKPIWAALVLDDGLSVDEAQEHIRLWHQEQHAIRRAQQCRA